MLDSSSVHRPLPFAVILPRVKVVVGSTHQPKARFKRLFLFLNRNCLGSKSELGVDLVDLVDSVSPSFPSKNDNKSVICARSLAPLATIFCCLSLGIYGDPNDEGVIGVVGVLLSLLPSTFCEIASLAIERDFDILRNRLCAADLAAGGDVVVAVVCEKYFESGLALGKAKGSESRKEGRSILIGV